MVHPLYWVTAMIFAVVLGILYIDEQKHLPTVITLQDIAFRKMMQWNIFFCLQDVFWGMMAGEYLGSPKGLMLASTIFHLSTVCTTYYWLNYVVIYLDGTIRRLRLCLQFGRAIIALQAAMLAVNLFRPVIFSITPDGLYVTEPWRLLAFGNQYIVYLFIGLTAGISSLSAAARSRQRLRAAFFFALFPILSGGLQFLYPDAPFYSMGYFLGSVVVYTFIVSHNREQLRQLQFERAISDRERRLSEEQHRANTDKLTGIGNRLAYENMLSSMQGEPPGENFIYMIADVNGLKTVNDSLGHLAGDELIRAASDCLKSCLAPYGTVYRIGGDEFAALFTADSATLGKIRQRLTDSMQRWHGVHTAELTVSLGFAAQADNPGLSLTELGKQADNLMYKDKAAYYASHGIDRRSGRSAFSAVCSSYTKILRINLTADTHQSIIWDEENTEKKLAYNKKISLWLKNFAEQGHVLEEDLAEYLSKTGLDFLRSHFAAGRRELRLFYRRRTPKGDFRPSMMEMVRAENYTDEDQWLYLYVKDIAK